MIEEIFSPIITPMSHERLKRSIKLNLVTVRTIMEIADGVERIPNRPGSIVDIEQIAATAYNLRAQTMLGGVNPYGAYLDIRLPSDSRIKSQMINEFHRLSGKGIALILEPTPDTSPEPFIATRVIANMENPHLPRPIDL